MKKLIFSLLLISGFYHSSFATPIGFEAAEHIGVGDQVKLRLALDEEPQAKIKLPLLNGLQLTYGEIVSLAGDFYGVPEKPIALGKKPDDKKSRFWEAYATLALQKPAVEEVPKIMAVIIEEQQQLKEGLERGERPADIYARIGTDHNIAWNCITGGLCPADYPDKTPEEFRKIYFLKQGRYLKLSATDFDHFGKWAWESYVVGHKIALEKAMEARIYHDKEMLKVAYSINAFACHYLSDRFASGHIRTPHLELYRQITPNLVGSLLATYMHREENNSGLNVENKRGNAWKAFGDGYYYDTHNQRNIELLEEAMQLSADEIFDTYLTGNFPTEDKVEKLIPHVIHPENNITPLFYYDEKTKKISRRVDLKDVHSTKTTTFWLGWTTLLELIKINGIPHGQESLLHELKEINNLT